MNIRTKAKISASMSKARPRCRSMIIKLGLVPILDGKDNWTYECLGKDGTKSFLSRGMEKEMKRMVADGYFDKRFGWGNK